MFWEVEEGRELESQDRPDKKYRVGEESDLMVFRSTLSRVALKLSGARMQPNRKIQKKKVGNLDFEKKSKKKKGKNESNLFSLFRFLQNFSFFFYSTHSPPRFWSLTDEQQ